MSWLGWPVKPERCHERGILRKSSRRYLVFWAPVFILTLWCGRPPQLAVAFKPIRAVRASPTRLCIQVNQVKCAQGHICRHAYSELRTAVEYALEGYENLLETQSLGTDVATAAFLNSASDTVAQLSEMRQDGKSFSAARSLRYGMFGSMDGFAGHYWFQALDAAPKSGIEVVDTLSKVLADSALYTPCWCVLFLFVMAIFEGRGAEAGLAEVRRDFWDLLKGNYGITLPFVALIYGLAPARYQVACFAGLTLAYTIVLSLWASSRHEAQDSVSEAC
mmetsp:Transcript_42378/g.79010  ORF Transcript_42378/g.79010 Transcript_42378/m.79010 type:complete len:277 (+) Transcript_42378:36-866(+)